MTTNSQNSISSQFDAILQITQRNPCGQPDHQRQLNLPISLPTPIGHVGGGHFPAIIRQLLIITPIPPPLAKGARP